MSRWAEIGRQQLTDRSRCEVLGCDNGLGFPRKATQGHHSLIGRDKNHEKLIDKIENWQAACAECNVHYRTADNYEALEYAVLLQARLHGKKRVEQYLDEVAAALPFSVRAPRRILQRIDEYQSLR